MITLTHYLVLSSILFVIGLIGIVRRKNLLMLFFSTEILLNEVAVGLGLLMLWYKRNSTIDLDSMQSMKG